MDDIAIIGKVLDGLAELSGFYITLSISGIGVAIALWASQLGVSNKWSLSEFRWALVHPVAITAFIVSILCGVALQHLSAGYYAEIVVNQVGSPACPKPLGVMGYFQCEYLKPIINPFGLVMLLTCLGSWLLEGAWFVLNALWMKPSPTHPTKRKLE